MKKLMTKIKIFFYCGVGFLIPFSYNACTKNFEVAEQLRLGEQSSSLSSIDPNDPWMNADTNRGKLVWNQSCRGCHGEIDSTPKKGATKQSLISALSNIAQMKTLKLSDQQLADVILAMNPPPTGNGTFTPAPIPTFNYACVPGADPGVSPVQRLSKRQYENALARLTGGLLLGREKYTDIAAGALATAVSAVPGDRITKGFARMDKDVTESHVSGYVAVALDAASKLKRNNDFFNWYGSSCLNSTTFTDACVGTFITNFGSRAFRRPILASEKTNYLNMYLAMKSTDPVAGVEAVIASLLLAPQFLFQMETEGVLVSGKTDVYNLTPFEVATRISLGMEDNIPSDNLWNLVSTGKFSTPVEIENYVNGIFAFNDQQPSNADFVNMNDIQDSYSFFFNEWLELYKRNLFISEDAIFQTFMAQGDFSIVWNTPPSHFATEINQMMFRNFWQEGGKFSTIMTDNKFYADVHMRSLYYLGPNYDAVSQMPDGYYYHPNRKGFLTRSAFLITNSHLTKPIDRGVFIRRKVLCDDLPSPNPDALPDRALASPELRPDMTTRERYAEKTKDETCMQCHSQINQLGFALEDFDGLGRLRAFEKIFEQDPVTKQVKIIASLPINSSSSNLGVSQSEPISVTGGVDMTVKLSQSQKAQLCFARQSFRFTFGHRESDNDSCLLQHMHQNLEGSGGSMKNMFMKMVSHPHFKMRKVGQ